MKEKKKQGFQFDYELGVVAHICNPSTGSWAALPASRLLEHRMKGFPKTSKLESGGDAGEKAQLLWEKSRVQSLEFNL